MRRAIGARTIGYSRAAWRLVRSLWRLFQPAAVCGAAAAALLCLIVYSVPKPLLVNPGSYSRAVFDGSGNLLRLTTASDDQYRLWTPRAEVAPQLVQATLLQEDRHFYRHFGVNPAALIRAAYNTYLLRGRRIGGSTISMQVARIRFGIESRNIGGKLWQILRALQLECHYSKDEILEAYLNTASYGGNIEGVGAASFIYFGKPAAQLTLAESLALAVIPQHPAQRRPANGDPLLTARRRLFERWIAEYAGKDWTDAAFDLPFVAKSSAELPFLAPHFTRRVLAGDDGTDRRPRIETTLDSGYQRMIEQRISGYLRRRRDFGLKNATALLVDSRDMAVLAQAGSADFFDASIQGQVDGTAARRSPGSTLKPFIYGLAIDQGLIHPGTLLSDAPRSFAAYNPENNDREFDGPISAEVALIRSRNVPAIDLANRLQRNDDGTDAKRDLYRFLREAGIKRMRDRDHYGLSLALGGVEVTMQELAELYAMLANDGILKRLRRLKHQLPGEGRRLLTPEASKLVLDMLAKNPRPESGGMTGRAAGPAAVRWKTGTSWGFRDAWAVGVVGPYVLAVWIGNFDSTSNPEFTGLGAAAPLFFEIVDSLFASPDFPAEHRRFYHYNIEEIEVCALSGALRGPACPHGKKTAFIPGKSPIKRCDIHRELVIDTETGYRTCFARADAAESPLLKRAVYEFWPSDMSALFAAAGLARRSPPPFSPHCVEAMGGDGALSGDSALLQQPLLIRSPEPKVEYIFRSREFGAKTIPFSAVADADAGGLYWFVDDAYVGKSAPGTPFHWTPRRAGRYYLRAVDERGRVGAGRFVVTLAQ